MPHPRFRRSRFRHCHLITRGFGAHGFVTVTSSPEVSALTVSSLPPHHGPPLSRAGAAVSAATAPAPRMPHPTPQTHVPHLHPRAARRRDGHTSHVIGLALRGVRARARRDGLVSVVLVTAVLAEPPRRSRAAARRRLDADAVRDVVRGRTRCEVACGGGGETRGRRDVRRRRGREAEAHSGQRRGSRGWKGGEGERGVGTHPFRFCPRRAPSCRCRRHEPHALASKSRIRRTRRCRACSRTVGRAPPCPHTSQGRATRPHREAVSPSARSAPRFRTQTCTPPSPSRACMGRLGRARSAQTRRTRGSAR